MKYSEFIESHFKKAKIGDQFILEVSGTFPIVFAIGDSTDSGADILLTPGDYVITKSGYGMAHENHAHYKDGHFDLTMSGITFRVYAGKIRNRADIRFHEKN